MVKFLKWFVMGLGVLIILGVIGYQFMVHNTKKHSPFDRIVYIEDSHSIIVKYSRPYKRDRVIFGELVKYDKVWRTGANEPTTFANSADLIINGKTLPAGEYTLWTKPREREWEIMFNRGDYGWGVGLDAEASRDPSKDVLVINAEVQLMQDTLEQFTISLLRSEDLILSFTWDQVHVEVPMEWAD